MKSIVPDQLIR